MVKTVCAESGDIARQIFLLARQSTSSSLQVKNTYAKCLTQTSIH